MLRCARTAISALNISTGRKLLPNIIRRSIASQRRDPRTTLWSKVRVRTTKKTEEEEEDDEEDAEGDEEADADEDVEMEDAPPPPPLVSKATGDRDPA